MIQAGIDHQPVVRQLLGHEPLLLQGLGGRFLSHQEQRRGFDLLQAGAEVQRIEVCLETASHGGRRPVHLGDVPLDQSLRRHPGVQPVVDGGGGPGADTPVQSGGLYRLVLPMPHVLTP